MEQTIKNTIDGGFITAGASAPWWVEYINTYGGVFLFGLAAIVGIIRLAIAIYDWKHRKKNG